MAPQMAPQMIPLEDLSQEWKGCSVQHLIQQNGYRIEWMYYYIIRTSEKDNRIIALHQVLDSAMAVFDQIIHKQGYKGYLELVRIHTDDHGMLVSERTIRSFSSSSGVLVSHQFSGGILVIKSPSTSPELTIRTPSSSSMSPGFTPKAMKKMTPFDGIELS